MDRPQPQPHPTTRKLPMRRIAYCAGPDARLAAGLHRFLERQPNWQIELVDTNPVALQQLIPSPPDGLLGYLPSDAFFDVVRHLGCPAVTTSGYHPNPPFPRVSVDSHEVGQLAARHLVDRGLTSFAILTLDGPAYSQQREAGFVSVVGSNIQRFTSHRPLSPLERQRTPESDTALIEWLLRLPRPTGLFAVMDSLAWWVSEVCLGIGLGIPDELAVIGCNDEPYCLLSRPPLSTVRLPIERIAFEAACLLEQLMGGQQPDPADLRLPPGSLIVRQSTDIVATADERVARAVRYIRTFAHEGIGVAEVAKNVALGRRSLEKRFHKALGRTPLSEIRRVRVERAQRLLLDPGLSIEQVAEACGLTSRRWLDQVFRRFTRESPAQYRQRVLYESGQNDGKSI